MRTLLLSIIPALLALRLFSGCSMAEDKDRDALNQNQARWEQQHLSDYQYQLRVSCFCPYYGTVTVTVRADTISSVEAPEVEPPVLPQDLNFFKTIDGLFEVVDEAIEEADQFSVQYDPQMGHPTKIDIDYLIDAVDDEVVYTAANVQPLTE